MHYWYEDEGLAILFDSRPQVAVRVILPTMTDFEKSSIKKYPFVNKREFKVQVEDKRDKLFYDFIIPKGYNWNGSDIPRIFWRLVGSKSEPQYLIASCLHDFMLENKSIIDYNRRLTSMVFKGCLIAAGVSNFKATIMAEAVDLFQRFQKWD